MGRTNETATQLIRFQQHYLNRWLSPDTIVSDPANPQSLNRYSYVNNRPLNFTDPSGHYEACEQRHCPRMTGDEARRRALLRTAELYGVTITGEGWDNYRLGAVVDAVTTAGSSLLPAYQQAATADLRNATRLARLRENRRMGLTIDDFRQLTDLGSASTVFKAVYGGVEFIHVMADSQAGNYGFTDPDFHGHRIEVYNQAFAHPNDPLFTYHFPAHELGHAFNQRAGRVPENNLGAANFGDFTPAAPWAQSDGNTDSEDFADIVFRLGIWSP